MLSLRHGGGTNYGGGRGLKRGLGGLRQQFNPQMMQQITGFLPQRQSLSAAQRMRDIGGQADSISPAVMSASQARLAQEKANFAPGGKWFGTGGPGLSPDSEEMVQTPQGLEPRSALIGFPGPPPPPTARQRAPRQQTMRIGGGDVIQDGGPGFAKPLSPQPGGGGGGEGGPPTSWKMSIEPMFSGGLVSLRGGGQMPMMVYANGGYIPVYGFGGFLKKVGKGIGGLALKAAPIALGAINPALGAGAGALISGIKNRNLKSAIVGGLSGYLGGKALKGGLSAAGGIGNLLKGKGLGAGADAAVGYLNDPKKLSMLYPMMGNLMGQAAEETAAQGGGDGYGLPQGAQVQSMGAVPGGPPIMPQSSQAGWQGAQGFTRAEGGLIPAYQYGGEMDSGIEGEGGMPMGIGGFDDVYQPYQPYVPPRYEPAVPAPQIGSIQGVGGGGLGQGTGQIGSIQGVGGGGLGQGTGGVEGSPEGDAPEAAAVPGALGGDEGTGFDWQDAAPVTSGGSVGSQIGGTVPNTPMPPEMVGSLTPSGPAEVPDTSEPPTDQWSFYPPGMGPGPGGGEGPIEDPVGTQDLGGGRTVDPTTPPTGPEPSGPIDWGQTGIPTGELDTEGLPPGGENTYGHGRQGQEDAEASTKTEPDRTRLDVFRESARDKGMPTLASIPENERNIIMKPELEAKQLNLAGSNLGSVNNPWSQAPATQAPATPSPVMPASAGGGGRTGPQTIQPSHADYVAGFHRESERLTGPSAGSQPVGLNPMTPTSTAGLTQQQQDFAGRFGSPPVSAQDGGLIPAYQEGGPMLMPSSSAPEGPPEEVAQIVEAMVRGEMPPDAQFLEAVEEAFPGLRADITNRMRNEGTRASGRDGIVTEGYIPPFADGQPESSGAVDDRLAISKDDYVQADFEQRLAEGGDIAPVAAVAAKEYILDAEDTASQGQDVVTAAAMAVEEAPGISGPAFWDATRANLDSIKQAQENV